MRLVVGYLIAFLVVIGGAWTTVLRNLWPSWIAPHHQFLDCVLIGGVGGTIYCLRAVYLNRSVRDRWDPKWTVWYFVRPVVSCVVGGVAFIFLKAGLLVLGAEHAAGSGSFGFLALSFIAGLNVDRFLFLVEDIALSTWGVRPSRTSEDSQATVTVSLADQPRDLS